MFILQHVQNAVVSYSEHERKSNLLAAVRGNYGLSQAEYDEFLINNGSFDRPEIYLGWWEGEVPSPEAAFAVKAAVKAQRERLKR